MGREKRNLPAAIVGGPKERHKRAQRSQYDPKVPVPEGLVAKPAIPKTKHHSYFEFVENKDKKKKLEFQVTNRKSPPPGFEFVPIGNPLLTTECKELSREKDAMIFIVSNAKDGESNNLAHQVHRIGHHIREIIVEEARIKLGQALNPTAPTARDAPEPIPESQEQYNAQVDAAIRDLFPRIPNTDRQMIIEHAFRKGTTFKGEKPVGLSEDITLARRVQLAVLAHIRHTHTRYDTLLKETSWQNARKVVEALCLDTLVKWRGDEETGRDQLDEILREVVVISDSEEESDEETDSSSVEEIVPSPQVPVLADSANHASAQSGVNRRRTPKSAQNRNGPLTPVRTNRIVKKTNSKRSSGRKAQRGFKRYQIWQEAIRRFREEQDDQPQPPAPNGSPSRGLYHGFVPPDSAPPYMSTGSRVAPQVRVIPDQAGPPPNENGYVAHPPTQHGRPLGESALPAYLPPTHRPVHEKVTSFANEPLSGMSVPRVGSPLTRPLQDMLVPSIEPASPEVMRPSFVRTVPPRAQAFAERPSPRDQTHFYTRPVSPPRDVIMRDGPVCANRRVVNDHVITGSQVSGSHFGNDRAQFSAVPRDSNYSSSHNGPLVSAPANHSDARPYGYDHVSSGAPSNRSYRDVTRPGDRGNPILMEDRGGFFELVPVHPDTRRPLPRDTEIIEIRRHVQEIRRGPEPHRMVSWEEGSRIPRESQGHVGVEAIPITGSHTLPQEARSRPVLADAPIIRLGTPNRLIYERRGEREARPAYYQVPEQESRPLPRDPHMPLYQTRREARHTEQLPQRQSRDERPLVDNRQPRRGFPLHPHRPENVIVLE